MEGIVVGHDHGLLVGDLAQLAQRRIVIAQPLGQLRQPFRHLRVTRHYRFAQVVEIHLGARIQQRGQQGDANRAPQVTQDIEQARRRPRILRLDVSRGDQRNGHHDHRLAKGADDLDMVELRPGKVRVEHPRAETGGAEQAEPQGAQQLGRHHFHQLWYQRDQKQLRHPHPHDHLADLQGVVALHLSQVQRQQVD